MKKKGIDMKKRIISIVISLFFISTVFFSATSIVSADNWSMFGHDPQHTRFADTTGPNNNNLLWSIGTGLESNAATIVDGVVYTNGVHAFDAMNGELLSSSMNSTKSTKCPAISNGYLYTSHRQSLGELAYVYCINTSTMATKWVFEVGYFPPENIVVTDGKVLFAVRDNIYCINAITGAQIWLKEGRGSGSPAVANNKVYISYYDKLHCLGLSNGDLLWEGIIADGQGRNHPPVVADGKVYIMDEMPNDKSVHYCFDAVDGALEWQVILDGKITEKDHSAAVADGNYYFASGKIGSGAGKLYCLDSATGVTKWSYTFENNMYSIASPAITNDGKLYISLSYSAGGSSFGRILCLDAMTRQKLWSEDIPTDSTGIRQSPKLYEGRVFVASNSQLYCFGTNSPPEIPILDVPVEGDVNQKIKFHIEGTTDPDSSTTIRDKIVYYQINWGDGVVTGWIGPFDEGERVENITHAFSEPGDQEIRVKAKDAYGEESEYSEPYILHIYRFKLDVSGSSGINPGVSFAIHNIGEISKDVNWKVLLVGGTFPGFHINKKYEGELYIKAGTTGQVTASPVFVLGKFKIEITVEIAGEPTLEETVEGFGLFFFIKV